MEYAVTRPHEYNPQWNGRIGRIDQDFIKENVKELERAISYICGPPDLIRSLSGLLRDLKVEPQRVRVESFHGDEAS